jgi:hypothetical protein
MAPTSKAPKAAATDDVDAAPPTIQLSRLTKQVMTVGIEGITPLIPHRWSEKSLRMMAEKQQQTGKATARKLREAKNPEEEANASCYWLPDGTPGMPATAFKAAMVGGARFFQGVTMTFAKTLFYVRGEGPDQLVRITGNPTLREDTPRNATGVADLRYRYAFYPWSATPDSSRSWSDVDQDRHPGGPRRGLQPLPAPRRR